ncbi:unnamed protein product, partial [Nesidiocoris tenuis]
MLRTTSTVSEGRSKCNRNIYMLPPHYLMNPRRQQDISHTRKSAAELKSTASTLGLSDTVRDWLVSRGTCPITYAWKDLGSDFWP